MLSSGLWELQSIGAWVTSILSSLQSFRVTSFLTLMAMNAGKPKEMKAVRIALTSCTRPHHEWVPGATRRDRQFNKKRVPHNVKDPSARILATQH